MLPMYLLSGCVIGLNVTVFDTGEIEVKEPNVDPSGGQQTNGGQSGGQSGGQTNGGQSGGQTEVKILLVQQQEVKRAISWR